jgi:radical SAM protein with 4Fe4S-binding SPASM domain
MKTHLIPKQIDIEVSGVCNLKCKYCPSLSPDAKTGYMDFDLFKSIIDRVNFHCTIVPWLNGEPLLHPRYTEIIEYIEEAQLPYYITTNGTIWDDSLFNLLIKSILGYQIIFSLDGLPDPRSRSIELARPGTDREEVLKNIHRFIDLKLANNSKINIAIKICQRGQDYEEIENFIGYWLKTPGVDYVCVGKALINDSNDKMRIFPCQYSENNFMVIKWNGDLVPCAYNDSATNKRPIILGDVRNDIGLLTLYNSEKYQKFRAQNRYPFFKPPCNTCGFAYTGTGLRGQIMFRDSNILSVPVYYQQDYYNEFFSLTKNWKPDSYYKGQLQ